MNMGTPGYPEGVSHWTNKALLSHKLERRRKRQQGYWLFFRECCGECQGRGFVENILEGVTAVRSEADYENYRPDILLERGDKPPIWLEITHTSPPSPQKLAYCASQGIDVFELEGSQHPVDSSVIRAYISPRNCRKQKRERLASLWQSIADLGDPIVGIKEDFRSPERQCRELETMLADSEKRRQDVADGKLRCARCDEPFTIKDGELLVSYIFTHLQYGGCGKAPFCDECFFAIQWGWDGVYPDDAASWGLNEDCPKCQPILNEQNKRVDKSSQKRSVSMPAPYGRRLVWEPEKRTQSYIVGDRTVSRDELQSVLMMFEYFLSIVVAEYPENVEARLMTEQVNKIGQAIQFANGIRDWDWLEGIGESYVPGVESQSTGDKFLYPKRWPGWQEFPQFPLKIV